ncbi:MAG TPA: DUF1800 domain-containing protein [Gemmatimonadales bacterium]|nr:DUF1800 domain-containing protein [Gemmatimonadales bacterium]
MSARDSAYHALNRLAYGATPGLVDRIAREGVLTWIDRQLAVERIDDPALSLRDQFPVLSTSPEDLLRTYTRIRQERRAEKRDAAGDSTMTPAERQRRMDPEARALREIGGELQQLVVVRAARSDHQLAEVMADFWANHFNVFYGKNLDRVYLPEYIEGTIRPNALGRFARLLEATAKSPAMMVYLDNAQSVAPGSRPPQLDRLERLGRMRGRQRFPNVPSPEQMEQLKQRMPTGLNENYARELMELHTLGVDGGYTQRDVTEVARVLTGWSVDRPLQSGGYAFHSWAHDRGAKTILGVDFPAGEGEAEGERLLRILADHPSTMHYVSGKLCARFVDDDPPDGCVDDAVRAWKRSDGSIREVLRAIFHSPDFWAPRHVGAKIKTPLEFVASAVRAVGGTPDSTPRLAQAVTWLGQPLYLHTAPNGYPERQDDWVNSGALLSRMNLAVQLAANRLPGVTVDLDAVLPLTEDHQELVDAVNRLILSGKMTAETRRVILDQLVEVNNVVTARALAVGLAIGGPEFQRQ